MTYPWVDFPNSPLLDEILELAKKYKDVIISLPQLVSIAPLNRAAWEAAHLAIAALGRGDIREEFLDRLRAIFGGYSISYSLFYCTALALIAWDDAGELYRLPTDQLRLTSQLLPESDWGHNAALLLLPLKEYLDAQCLE